MEETRCRAPGSPVPPGGSTALLLLVFGVAFGADPLTPKEQLGKAIFFDENLSANGN